MKGLFFILSLSVCSLFHPAMAQYRSERYGCLMKGMACTGILCFMRIILIRMSVR